MRYLQVGRPAYTLTEALPINQIARAYSIFGSGTTGETPPSLFLIR